MITPARHTPLDYGKATRFDSLEFQVFAVFAASFTLLALVGGIHLSNWLSRFHGSSLLNDACTFTYTPVEVLLAILCGCLLSLLMKRLRWNLSIVLIVLSCYSGIIFGSILPSDLSSVVTTSGLF